LGIERCDSMAHLGDVKVDHARRCGGQQVVILTRDPWVCLLQSLTDDD